MLTMGETLFRFADTTDKVYFYFGAFASFGFGAALPGFCLFFSELIDNMGASTQGSGFGMLNDTSLYMVFFACFVWIFSGSQVTAMAVFAERISIKVKMQYFLKCIEKDAEYYDKNDPT